MSRWYRFYDSAIDDPKVQRLPDALFKTWVNLLCLASQTAGVLPPLEDIAFRLRLSEKEAVRRVSALKQAGLLDDYGDMIEPHNWRERQKPSDSSAERVKRHRERQASVSCNVTETPQSRSREDVETDKNAAALTRDLNEIEAKCREAAKCDQSASAGLCNLAPILGLLDGGADLDRDILPALRAKPNSRAGSWGYFVGQIQDFRAQRLAAANPVEPRARAGPGPPAGPKKSASQIVAELNAKSHERYHHDASILDLVATPTRTG